MSQSEQPITSPAIVRRLGPPGKWFQFGSIDGFEWTHVTLPVIDLPDGLVGTRIVHLTDLHATSKWHTAYDVILENIRAAKPDLVLITGDFVDDKIDHIPALPTIGRFIDGLSAKLGIYGILGNHDSAHFESRLVGSTVTLLNGQSTTVSRNGCPIELIGMPGAERWDLTDAWIDAFPPPAPSVPRIVMSHFPDHVRHLKRLSPDMLLCGHTHGGQICLPGRIVVRHNDKLPRKYNNGVHRIDNTWLIANRGLGYTTIPLRLFCPSEVIEIELIRA